MSEHTYRVIEIVGSSPDGVDAAIRNAVSRAAETTRGLDWFEVQSVRGHLENGAIGHFQVTLKVGFRLEDTPGSAAQPVDDAARVGPEAVGPGNRPRTGVS